MNVTTLGGRHLEDIVQFVYSLESEVKAHYEVNAVPVILAKLMKQARTLATDLTHTIEEIGKTVGN